MDNIGSWEDVINQEKALPYYKNLKKVVDDRYEKATVFPPKNLIFNAFSRCKLDSLKAVILGQDPYHGRGQAHGLCFSTPKNIKNPPSVVNIFEEIFNDTKIASKCLDGDLTPWSKQGVLMLNSSLTVEEGKPASHRGLGWEIFTDNIIKFISKNAINIVFILWGKHAKDKKNIIDTSKHFILEAAHPSPFSAHNGFFGCKHFSKTNELLSSIGKEAVIW